MTRMTASTVLVAGTADDQLDPIRMAAKTASDAAAAAETGC